MLIECCSQERTYLSFYGHLGERFCKVSPVQSYIEMALYSYGPKVSPFQPCTQALHCTPVAQL